MTGIAIRVENLSKRYRIGQARAPYGSLRESLAQAAAAPFHRLRNRASGRRDGDPDSIWALKDVSFEVERGEVVGVIGRNGAGKSTLLKILSRITKPTGGYARVRGRVGSLLEVGTGFHPELTGRENVYLNGAVLGMRRAEIERKFDEVVAFAEIEPFLDTPVKRYSSGMYMRLAFAVAAHLEPEILLIDEVLAVGDVSFQKKCIGRMGKLSEEGRTVLFVSHNLQAISTLTKHCILLSNGKCIGNGLTDSMISEYLKLSTNIDDVYEDNNLSQEPKIAQVKLITSEPNHIQINGKAMEIHFTIFTPLPIDGASLSFQACNSWHQPILHLWTFDSERPMCRAAGVYKVVCTIPNVRLYMGHYSLTVHFSEHAGGMKFQTIEGICPFEVVMFGHEREFKWSPGACTYTEESDWKIKKITKEEDDKESTSRIL